MKAVSLTRAEAATLVEIDVATGEIERTCFEPPVRWRDLLRRLVGRLRRR